MKRMFVVYAGVTIGLFMLGIVFAKSNIMIMIDMPSLMLVLGPAVLMLLSHFGPKEFIGAFRAAMEKNRASGLELKNALLFFSTAQTLIIASTVATVFLGHHHDTGQHRQGIDGERHNGRLVDGR